MSFYAKRAHAVALVLILSATMAACASRPKPEPAQTTSPPAQTTAPSQATPDRPPTTSQNLPPPSSTTGAPVPGSEQDFVVNVGDRVYFDTDQYTVRSDAQSILNAQAAWLQRYPNVRVRIEGNADERGTREYNFALGGRRAESVRNYLVSRGVAANRIETVSYGKERPIDPGTDEAAWQRNRNAHTAIIGGAAR